MSHEVETMFSAREVPWHGLGTITEDVLTASDAIEAAGLDWEVKKHSTYVGVGKNKVKIPNKFGIVRQSDMSLLGVVGGRYEPLQNAEAFTFMDNLVDSGMAKYETAGSLKGGSTVFITMKVPQEVLIGGEDLHEFYIMLRNSHNGLHKLTVDVTPIRAVCQNTVTLAIANAVQHWEAYHTSQTAGKVQEARETIQATFQYIDGFKQMGEDLLAVKVSDAEIEALLTAALPKRPTTPDTVKDIIGFYNDSPVNGYKGTGWGVFNAVTEYFDHGKESKSIEARFRNIMDGNVAAARNKTAQLLLLAK